MRHVRVKLHAGLPAEIQASLAQDVTRTLMATLGAADTFVSFAFEHIKSGVCVDQFDSPEVRSEATLRIQMDSNDPRHS